MPVSPYPVRYAVDAPERFTRLQLLIRVLAFIALGMVGLSFGAVFLFAYVALPIVAASRLASGRSAEAYVREDGPHVLSALAWLAAVSAWAGLIVDRLPERSPAETVKLSVEGTARPTPASAVWRVLTGLPSALVLMLLGWLGSFVWIWAALTVLVNERVGPAPLRYLVGLQRYSLRLLVYQASLVDEYPPFSFADVPPDPNVTLHVAGQGGAAPG